MDNQIDISQNNQANSSNRDDEFALHKLNDHCLLEIFSYLRPKDAENLAKMSKRLKSLSLYPMHKLLFKFHSDMVTKNTEQNVTELDTVLGEYGEHIKSWSLTIVNEKWNFDRGVEVLRRVSQYSTNLKKLEIRQPCDFRAFVTACEDAATCFENVEYLICDWCEEYLRAEFLRLFRKLKHVYLSDSGAYAKDYQVLFRNNQDIESFHINGGDGFSGGYSCEEEFCNIFSLCEFGSKFDKLCLGAICEAAQMGPMRRLATTNLTKLKLDVMCVVDFDIFIAEMAKSGNLKELELHLLKFNHTLFDVLQSCQQLELLVLREKFRSPQYQSVLSSVVWPPNLKYLRTNFRFTDVEFLSTIQQLKCLERLRLSENSKIDLHLVPLNQKLEHIFKTRIRRPNLQFTIGMSGLVIDFQYNRVLYVPADINSRIGIDFSVNTYVDWQWNAKRTTHDEPKKAFRRPMAGPFRFDRPF